MVACILACGDGIVLINIIEDFIEPEDNESELFLKMSEHLEHLIDFEHLSRRNNLKILEEYMSVNVKEELVFWNLTYFRFDNASSLCEYMFLDVHEQLIRGPPKKLIILLSLSKRSTAMCSFS